MLIYLEIALRLVLAMCIGGGIGWERARRHHPAGIRTHAGCDRRGGCHAARRTDRRRVCRHGKFRPGTSGRTGHLGYRLSGSWYDYERRPLGTRTDHCG